MTASDPSRSSTRILVGPTREGIIDLAVLPGGRLACTSGPCVRVWNLADYRHEATFAGHDDEVNALAVLPGRRLASAGDDGVVCVWDLEAKRLDARFAAHYGCVWDLVTLPDGRLASACQDGTICIWNVERGCLEFTLERHSDTVNALVVLPDGRLASGSDDRTVRVWNLEVRQLEATFTGHERLIWALAVASEDRVASASWDRTICVWDVDEGRLEATLEGHTDEINSLIALPDGRLASGSDDATVRIWNVEDRRLEATLVGHESSVWAISALPGGRLASSAADESVRIWTVDGRLETVLSMDAADAFELVRAPDGHLIAGRSDGKVCIWSPKHDRDPAADEHPWDLWFAAEAGDAIRLRELVARGDSLAQTWAHQQGWSALHLAADAGSAEAVKVLLDAGMDPDLATPAGVSALVLTPSVEVARLLLAAGADINQRVGDSAAVARAFADRHDEVGELLLDAGARVPASARAGIVEACARRGRLAALARLAEHGPELRALFVEPRSVAAAIVGGVVVLDFMLAHGAQLPDDLLEQAIAAGSLELTEAALRLPGARERCGPSSAPEHAMCVAAANADLALMQLLAEHGVPVAPELPGETSPLHTLALADVDAAVDCMQWLLASGVAVDACNQAGESPLLWAGRNVRVRMVELLLDHGADSAVLAELERGQLGQLRGILDPSRLDSVPNKVLGDDWPPENS